MDVAVLFYDGLVSDVMREREGRKTWLVVDKRHANDVTSGGGLLRTLLSSIMTLRLCFAYTGQMDLHTMNWIQIH